MNASHHASLPLDQWSRDMQAAVHGIAACGSALLSTHRRVDDTAEEVANQWKLEGRLVEEQRALEDAFSLLYGILTAADDAWKRMHDLGGDKEDLLLAMRRCANLIDEGLPKLQQHFLVVRHCALDMLLWANRYAPLADSDLPQKYRDSYAQLLSYAPIFSPRLKTMQQDLLSRCRGTQAASELPRLVTALSHYTAAVESARAFVRSVVDPPMELVFHDTETFQKDWSQLTPEEQADYGTKLNDTCQFLLYDLDQFHRAVQHVNHPLAVGMETSLYVLPVDDWRILLTVDEDPVFEQIAVTLLRGVPARDLNVATESVVPMLYRDFPDS